MDRHYAMWSKPTHANQGAGVNEYPIPPSGDPPVSKIVLTLVAMACMSACSATKTIEAVVAPGLEVYAELDQAVGNIAFLPDGNLVFSYHPFFRPELRVVAYDFDSQTVRPFPDKEWNTPRTANENYLDDVLGVRSDTKGVVWMLDMGTRNNVTPKLVGWDTKADKIKRVYKIPAPVSTQTSQFNDFVIDPTRQLIVIADEGIARGGDGSNAALVIVDLRTGNTRRMLNASPVTAADREYPIRIDGKLLSASQDAEPKPFCIGADGITIDAGNEWLYFTPYSGNKVYRVKMDHIANESLTDNALLAKVEEYSSKPNNGGLTIDRAGNLYYTDIEAQSIGWIPTKGRGPEILASDERLLWPDGLSYNRDGFMYVAASQVHLGAPFNKGVEKSTPPFYIFRFKPRTNGIFGR